MMAQDSISLVPLHNGRTFICYRDVNRAIDQHRELYGLKLTLKKATKLENYPLTPEQLQSLNLRLKYGELHYTCSIDNGRVGRPGNDEKCHLLVCIRLSADGRTLVGQQTHIHEYSDKKGYGKAINTPVPPPMATRHQFTGFAALPSPSALAATIAAAAAAAAGPSALTLPMQHQQPILLQHQPTGLVGLPPNTNLTILPHQLAASLAAAAAASSTTLSMQASHPDITIRNIPGTGPACTKTSPSNSGAVSSGPLPGQLLIPSFYSSKSPAGNITFSSTGARKPSAQQVFHNASFRMLTAGNSIQQYAGQSFSNVSAPSHIQRVGGGYNNAAATNPVAPEKITMKLKKSQFSPNEMVVVGSVRDAREQQDLRKVDKSTPRTSHAKKSSSGGRINAVVANLLEKVVNNSNNSLSVTHVMAPVVSRTTPSQAVTSSGITFTYQQPTVTSSAPHHQMLMSTTTTTLPAMTATKTSSANRNVGGMVGSKAPGGVDKPKSDGAVVVPGQNAFPLIDHNSLKRLQERIRAKKAQKAAMKVKVKVKPLSLLRAKQSARPVGRPLGSTKANRLAQRLGPPIQQIRGTSSGPPNTEPRVPNKPGRPPGTLMDRKVRQCRQRAPGSSAPSLHHPPPLVECPDKLLPIDTELGEYSKQRVAQRVLVQLLRTTTQLPMVEFSHAMDTIVTLTDALRLKHRVQLSIHHDEDDNDGAFALLGASCDDDDLSRQLGYRDTALDPGLAVEEADQHSLRDDVDTKYDSSLRECPTEGRCTIGVGENTRVASSTAPAISDVKLKDDDTKRFSPDDSQKDGDAVDAENDSSRDLNLIGSPAVDSNIGDDGCLRDSQVDKIAKRKSSENDQSLVVKRVRVI